MLATDGKEYVLSRVIPSAFFLSPGHTTANNSHVSLPKSLLSPVTSLQLQAERLQGLVFSAQSEEIPVQSS